MVSAIGSLLSVRYFFCPGSKKLKTNGGNDLISEFCGTTTCSNALTPDRPMPSLGSTLLLGGYDLNSRQSGCAGSVNASSSPRPVIRIFTVSGSPTAKSVGPAATAMVYSPTVPLNCAGTFPWGKGSTRIGCVSERSVVGTSCTLLKNRSNTSPRREFADGTRNDKPHSAGPIDKSPIFAAVANTLKTATLKIALPMRAPVCVG